MVKFYYPTGGAVEELSDMYRFRRDPHKRQDRRKLFRRMKKRDERRALKQAMDDLADHSEMIAEDMEDAYGPHGWPDWMTEDFEDDYDYDYDYWREREAEERANREYDEAFNYFAEDDFYTGSRYYAY